MAEVSITLNGRIYEISCDPGQEGRIVDLAAYIDQRLQKIARTGGAYNDAHLLVLTSLVLADELYETREQVAGISGKKTTTAASPADEAALAKLIEHLSSRIDGIAERVQSA